MNAVSLQVLFGHITGDPDSGFGVETTISVLVQNLAYTKVVGLWGHNSITGTWGFTPCSYNSSVAGNLEIWQCIIGEAPDQFDVEYQALGNIYWDNNSGYNYSAVPGVAPYEPQNVVLGVPNVLRSFSTVDSTGNLRVSVYVKNIAYDKKVGMLYTTNNWHSFQYAWGIYSQSFFPTSTPHQLNAEQWDIVAPIGVGATGQFAVFYAVSGTTYWDNNFGLNYPF